MMSASDEKKTVGFYILAVLFALFVLFLYGPMLVVFVLSFQGPNGGMTLPLDGVSTKWFSELFQNSATGDIGASLRRSLGLSAIVAIITVVFSFYAGLAFRRRFWGSGALFYFVVASLIMPGFLIGLGISLTFTLFGFTTDWTTSALGAQLTWTLPFGLLIMFAVLGRFDRSVETAAVDLGATNTQRLTNVVIPIVLPGLIGVALFGLTLSYDEFPRSLVTVGTKNTLPLEIWVMTTTVTSPALYALGTVTSIVSFAVVISVLYVLYAIRKKRQAQ
jgi:putative spermidine/putrescine transport system permease protein